MNDKFSRQADLYARYRPEYPHELFDFILNLVTGRNAAWDCATGNGQTAKELSKHFKKVFATDISQRQIDHAFRAENIHYSVQAAEHTAFEENTFDLVTVSQALHWLNIDKFYTEVKRVAKNGAWVAAWMYSLCHITPEIDEWVNTEHYRVTLKGYWDYERKYVEDNYSSLPFPFDEIETPSFQIELCWTLDELKGYLDSWSALQKFIAANHYNPVEALMKKISPFWTRDKMKVIFPLYLRMGRMEK